MFNTILIYCLLNYHPVIYDSSIYQLDITNLRATVVELNDEVIDYVVDEFLYVLTRHYLYKIQIVSADLQVMRRIPIPVRCNYLTIGPSDLILVATEEIIMVDKSNLSFKGGIGIEPGDYEPLIAPLDLRAMKRCGQIYLMNDAGNKTIIKIIDLNTGKCAKQKNVTRLVCHFFDQTTNTIHGLDIENNFITYDLNLKRIKKIKLSIDAQFFTPFQQGPGYLLFNHHALFWITDDGQIIDLQPLLSLDKDNLYNSNLYFSTEKSILSLSPLTLRTRWIRTEINNIIRIVSIDDFNSIGFDNSKSLYLLGVDSAAPISLGELEIATEVHAPPISNNDSLWYLQIAAFSQRAGAQAFSDSLNQTGIPVFIDSSDLYRVKLGGFIDENTAIEIAESLELDAWLIYQIKTNHNATKHFVLHSKKYILEKGIITQERSNP